MKKHKLIICVHQVELSFDSKGLHLKSTSYLGFNWYVGITYLIKSALVAAVQLIIIVTWSTQDFKAAWQVL